jgi:hypothetical protein
MIVFVSSTYRDLAEYREIIRVALETSGIQFRGMEQFPAQQDPPLQVALNALDQCDVYVGIVGELYGSSPPGRVLSYTELEYNHAKARDMQRIILVLSDDANVNREQVERDPEKLERLTRFRDRLLRDHTIQRFDDVHEAAWKLLAALITHQTRLREEQGHQ